MRGIRASDELASGFLDVAIECNELGDFVFSISIYDLKVDDGYGNPIHSAQHVMTALYNRQRSEPEIDYGRLICDAIITDLKSYRYQPTILRLLENLEYHAHAEKTGQASFSLDLQLIFSAIKNHIQENEEIYRKGNQTFGPYGMWPDLEFFNQRLASSVGLQIL